MVTIQSNCICSGRAREPYVRRMEAKSRIALGLLVIYAVWGSTYLAIRVALETIPPFVLAGARFMVAGAILFALARFAQARERLTLQHVFNAAVFGVFLMVIGNGGLVWAEQRAPSGIAAVFLGTVPMWTVLIDRLSGTKASWMGVALGLGGVVLLVLDKIDAPIEPVDAAVL